MRQFAFFFYKSTNEILYVYESEYRHEFHLQRYSRVNTTINTLVHFNNKLKMGNR